MQVDLIVRGQKYEVIYEHQKFGKRRRDLESVTITAEEGSGISRYQHLLRVPVDLIPELCALLKVIYKGQASRD